MDILRHHKTSMFAFLGSDSWPRLRARWTGWFSSFIGSCGKLEWLFPIQPQLFGPKAQESQTLNHDRRGLCHCLQGRHSDLSHLCLAGLKLSKSHVRQPFIINLQ
eukprot:Skav202408  [mRNA]  locus=scaffold815:509835:510755:- [translate_table: standard]